MSKRLAFRKALSTTFDKHLGTIDQLPRCDFAAFETLFEPLLESERITLAHLLVEILTETLENTDGGKMHHTTSDQDKGASA